MSELDDARAAVVELEERLARHEDVSRDERRAVHGRYQEASLADEKAQADQADPNRPAPHHVKLGG